MTPLADVTAQRNIPDMKADQTGGQTRCRIDPDARYEYRRVRTHPGAEPLRK